MAPTVLLDTWAAAMWRACWQGSIVVLAVWMICWLLPSMPARFQCWFWRLAIVKFMVVLLVPWLLNLPLLPVPSAAIRIPVSEVALQTVRATPRAAKIPVNPMDHLKVSPSKTIHRGKAIELLSLRTILGFAWIIGVGWSLACLLAAWYKAIRLRRDSRNITCASLMEQLTMQGKLFGLRTLPRLVEVTGSGSPMLIGAFRPAIVFPADTLGRLSISERTMVLGHELSHICRGDLFWGLIASIVRAVFFFHPLVWWSERQLKFAQEVAADESVIARQHHEPVDYASLLVSVVRKLGSRPLVSTISVETAGTVHSLARRLVAMTRNGRTSRRVVVSSIILLGTTVLLGLVPWRLVAAEPKEGEKRPLPPTVAAKQALGQAKVVAEIENLGGKVTVDERRPDKPVIRVDLPGSEVTDAGLKHLKGLTQLQTLNLQQTGVTNAGLIHFKGLTNLQSLDLGSTQVTDAGLEHLKGLTELQTLSLWRTKITGAGLVHLKGLTKLQLLEMSETKVTNAGLEHLKGLTQLKALCLGGTKVTDAGLEHLEGLTQLQTLNLAYTRVTDAGLKRLKRLTKLQRLDLPASGVTDEGLEHIKGLLQLQSLTFFSTQVTDKGLEHLKGLTQLKMLHLAQTRVTDAGLGHLEGLTELQTLYLGDTNVSGVGLGHLKGLTNLEILGLDDTQVSDAGMEHLKRLTNLQCLNLCGTRVTDAGLEPLKRLTKLQQVYLGRTKVTDAGLEYLKGLTQLQILDLSETGVTDEGVQNLQQALPQCNLGSAEIPSQM